MLCAERTASGDALRKKDWKPTYRKAAGETFEDHRIDVRGAREDKRRQVPETEQQVEPTRSG